MNEDTGSSPSTGRRLGGVVGGFIGLICMSAVAGLLVTVAVTPALALSGMTATNTINMFENLPGYIALEQLSQKSNIYARQTDGTPVLMASFYQQNRVEVGSDAISPFVKDAVVSSEDPRFLEHGGIDLQGTISGAVSTFAGGGTRGGSSITQQYVKNVLVQKCEAMQDQEASRECYVSATEISASRKLKEMRLAIGMEKEYSKDDILRGYLNITGFGGTVYGIEAAANYYFNTNALNLTLPQAASLVAIVNNPVRYQLDRPASEFNGAASGYAANKQRRDYILREMLTYDKITQEEHDEAVATVIEPVITPPSTGCQTAGDNAFFCDYVTRVLKTDATFGADEDARAANIRLGGYDVYTSLDLDVQGAAVATMNSNVPKTYAAGDLGGVITSVQVGTGRVLAMTQSKDYSQDPAVLATGANYTSLNYNTDKNMGGSSGFQPGSTYKVFTLAQWLSDGHALGERVDSARKANWGTFSDRCLGPQNYNSQGWNPRNDSLSETGAHYSALQSTINSYNTGFIGMAKRLDLCDIKERAESFGVHRADGDPLKQSAATVIGTNEIAPLTMAVAFAGIANNGVTCSPIVIDQIIGANGEERPIPQSTCETSVQPSVAAGMTYAMQRVMTSGTARASYWATSPRVPMIAKTGTTDSGADTWMTGASSKVATVAGVVSLTGKLSQRSLRFASGRVSEARHRMWPDVMDVANAKYGGDAFAEPTSEVINGVPVSVPDVRGMQLSQAKATIQRAGFRFAHGGVITSDMPEGTVVRSDPSRSAFKGSTVTVFTSSGVPEVVPEPSPTPDAPAPDAPAEAPGAPPGG
ncbi:transglycosylase domain-containing protein [Cryobacterium psychrophilum]|uniref:PASTA domain-containing protein n=1 Tax=Cryobacterium psychrophilum TaxID=41988 RepID=A0A4Y8KND0_9MICO|nr:transglycosylase domain-containing protein [Cryobacterium psychrophilum]TDW29106.1 membrane peptidoglycan carboxypeptidase [Cryobacterium psychrophilum]TFD79685.1 PASTA domain-containing protein [Cryobacterium psychrophilum]